MSGLEDITGKNSSDIVIIDAIRTPITRAKKGGFKDAYPEELLGFILQKLIERTGINPSLIEDVAVGTVLSELGGAKAGRMAMNHFGYPSTVSFHTVNRQCASGLQAIVQIANSINSGQIKIGIGAGVESMTRNYETKAIPQDLSPILKNSNVKDALDCIMPMGLTSENVSDRYNISRKEQDMFALNSHSKATKAQINGHYSNHLIPTPTRYIDNNNSESIKIIQKDDGVRNDISLEKLAKLKPAFKKNGSSTAGNSSQVSDGASAVLLMKRETAVALGLKPIGKFVSSQVVGVPPDEMGIGPSIAIPKLLEKVNLSIDDVDIIELNEAFASQALYCIKKLNIPQEKVNPNGGAIAIGHPLGCTGARLLADLLGELKRQNKKIGIVSMCMGTGMGMASIFVRE